MVSQIKPKKMEPLSDFRDILDLAALEAGLKRIYSENAENMIISAHAIEAAKKGLTLSEADRNIMREGYKQSMALGEALCRTVIDEMRMSPLNGYNLSMAVASFMMGLLNSTIEPKLSIAWQKTLEQLTTTNYHCVGMLALKLGPDVIFKDD